MGDSGLDSAIFVTSCNAHRRKSNLRIINLNVKSDEATGLDIVSIKPRSHDEERDANRSG